MSKYVFGFGAPPVPPALKAAPRPAPRPAGPRPPRPARPAGPRPPRPPRPGRRHGRRPQHGPRWSAPPIWLYPSQPIYEPVFVMPADPFVQACEAAGGAYAQNICWLPDGSTRTRAQGVAALLGGVALAGLLLLK